MAREGLLVAPLRYVNATVVAVVRDYVCRPTYVAHLHDAMTVQVYQIVFLV